MRWAPDSRSACTSECLYCFCTAHVLCLCVPELCVPALLLNCSHAMHLLLLYCSCTDHALIMNCSHAFTAPVLLMYVPVLCMLCLHACVSARHSRDASMPICMPSTHVMQA